MLEIIECEQNSEEWHAARMGIPTASKFATVMAKGHGGGASKTRKEYLYKLAGEIITGTSMENYRNAYMDRGHEFEDEARQTYEFLKDVETTPVGFIRNGPKGASPDALIGDHGLLEIKTQAPHLLIDRILREGFPPEHVAQCQGQLWVAEREWLDIAVYYPGMSLFIERVRRDQKYILNLSSEVSRFNEDLADVVTRVRAYNPFARAAA